MIPFRLTVLASLCATSALAQEPAHNQSILVEEPVACENWGVGVDFESCDRIPWPGGEGGYQQIYTLSSGQRRTLRFDPQASQIASEQEPTLGDAPGIEPRITSTSPTLSIAEQIAARRAASTASEADPRDDDLDELQHRRRRSSASQPAASSEDEADTSPISSQSPAQGAEEAPETEYDSGPSRFSRQAAPDMSRRSATATDERGDEGNSIIAPSEAFVLPNVITILPGRTELLPMAIGHLNRLETPFSDPMVRTSAAADALTVEFDQNFVYVALSQAVTLFIHERGHPDPAIVVALIPEQIAPRQVRLNVPAAISAQIKKQAPKPAVKSSASSKTPGPRANSAGVHRDNPPGLGQRSAKAVRDLRTFSEGRMPRGYQSGSIAAYAAKSFCAAQGVTFTFSQGAMIFDGTNYIVRGMATTRSKKPVDLNEQWCMAHPGSLAAGFFPRTQISNDAPTDFYIILTRPELLGIAPTAREADG